MEAFIGLAKVAHVAFRRPGFDAEFRLGLAGDEIDLAAVRLDVIDDDVAVLAPPFGAVVDPLAIEQRGRIRRAIGDASGEIHRRLPEQDIAHDRMHAVGADHGIGDCGRAVGESQAYAVSGLIQSGELVAESHAFVGYGAGERRVKIAAMREQVGRAEFLFGALAEDHVELDVATLPVPVVPGARVERPATHALLQPQLAQHLHGVAADLDSGAQPRELLRLLIDRDRDADPAQRGGGCEPAHAGANDRDVERFCHRPLPQSLIYAGLNPAFVSAARDSSDFSASRNARTAGRSSRARTIAKS